MKAPYRLAIPVLLTIFMGALSGCTPPVREKVQPQLSPEQLKAQNAYQEGMRLYEGGFYFLAEEQFLSPAIWNIDTDIQLKSLKYLAFSYCVSERKNQCRFAFERALEIDPNFRLDDGEESHPIWGPIYAKAITR